MPGISAVGIFIEVVAHIVELIFDLGSRNIVGFVINFVVKRVDLGRRRRICPNMRVFAHINGIIAVVKFVSVNAVGVHIVVVIRSHGAHGHSYGNGIAHAGLNEIGLFITAQHYVRFFYFAVGIRSAVIELNDFLARNFARVCHGYVDHDVAVLGELVRAEFHIPVERSVRKAVAEGIYDVFIVPLPSLFVASGFVIAVTHVNSFVVFDEIDACTPARFIHIRTRIVGREIGKRGVFFEIGGIYVYRSSRRIDLSVEHLAEGVDAAAARKTEPQYAVDAFVVFQRAEFKRRRDIENDDNLIELLLCHFDERFFIIVQFEIMVAGCGVAVIVVIASSRDGSGVICPYVGAFAAGAGQKYYCRVIVIGKAVFYVFGVTALGSFTRERCDLTGAGTAVAPRTGRAVVGVERPDRRVDFKPGIFKAVVKIIISHAALTAAVRARSRTAAAINGVVGIFAEHGDFVACRKGKGRIFVLHQNDAFLDYFLIELVGSGESIGRACSFGAELRNVIARVRCRARRH